MWINLTRYMKLKKEYIKYKHYNNKIKNRLNKYN